jgi:hypothetical protein
MAVVRLLCAAWCLAVVPSGVAAQASFRPAPLQRSVAVLRLQSLLASPIRPGPVRPGVAVELPVVRPGQLASRFPGAGVRVALAGPFELQATLAWQQAPRCLLAVVWRR